MAFVEVAPTPTGPVENTPTIDRAVPTPGGYQAATGLDTGKVKGSAGDDKITLFDLSKDTDKQISAGKGDDIFTFGVGDKTKVNGLVDLGDGNDAVYLAHEITDYKFTFRENGSLKIEYIVDQGLPTEHGGTAITFQGAESFVFRNVSDTDGTFHAKTEYTPLDLAKYFLAEAEVATLQSQGFFMV